MSEAAELSDLKRRLDEAEKALRESESRYRGLIENSGLGIHLVRAGSGHEVSGRLFTNDALVRLLGYDSAEEIEGKPSFQLVAPYDRKKAAQFHEAASTLPLGTSQQYECDFVRKDGSVIPLLVIIGKIMWEGEEAIQRTVIDLSERKRAEQARTASEERLRAVIDHSPSLIYLKDTDSRMVLVNKAFTEIWEVSQQDAVGKEGQEWLWPEISEKMKQRDRQVLSEGQPVETEYIHTDSRGTTHVMRSIKFPVRDKAGYIVGIGGISTDITESKRAEEVLAQKSALLQTTLDHMAEGISVYDANLKLIAFNQFFAEMYEFPPGFIRLGRSYEEIARFLAESGHYGPGNVEEQVRARLERAHRGEARQFERTGANGKRIAVWRNPLPGGGFVNTYTDITERNRAEEALRQAKSDAEKAAAEASEANAAKSRFLANMSHEIRTPMNGVLGMADLLSKTDLTPGQRDHVNTIRESGRSLLDLLNDILDLSKIEAGRIELDKKEFSIDSLLKSTRALWAPQAEDKGIAFTVHNQIADGSIIKSDQGRIRQVLYNLIGNAIKFTPQGSVELHATELPRDDGPAALRFEVRDTGIGLSKKQLEKLFQPFTQADSSTARKYGGTGLGLTISKSFVELLGGEIGVESMPDEGSVFWFTVIAERGDAQRSNLRLSRVEPGTLRCAGHERTLRILVAEDNHINQKIVAGFLEPLNGQLDFVENGLAAVAAVTRSKYDLILMDIHMPEMDGPMATERIRSLPDPVGKIPIIALTANAMQGDRKKYLDAGMNDYVAKPIDQRELLGAIIRCTDLAMSDGASAESKTATDASGVADAARRQLNDEAAQEIGSMLNDLDSLLDKKSH